MICIDIRDMKFRWYCDFVLFISAVRMHCRSEVSCQFVITDYLLFVKYGIIMLLKCMDMDILAASY